MEGVVYIGGQRSIFIDMLLGACTSMIDGQLLKCKWHVSLDLFKSSRICQSGFRSDCRFSNALLSFSVLCRTVFRIAAFFAPTLFSPYASCWSAHGTGRPPWMSSVTGYLSCTCTTQRQRTEAPPGVWEAGYPESRSSARKRGDACRQHSWRK